MDPNETVRAIAECDDPEEIAYLMNSLVEWIRRGGFPPSQKSISLLGQRECETLLNEVNPCCAPPTPSGFSRA